MGRSDFDGEGRIFRLGRIWGEKERESDKVRVKEMKYEIERVYLNWGYFCPKLEILDYGSRTVKHHKFI